MGTSNGLIKVMKLLTLSSLGDLFEMKAVGDFIKICRLRFTSTPPIRVVTVRDGRARRGRRRFRVLCRRIRENKLYLVRSVVGRCGLYF
jgi:hypothetical protein